MVEIVEPAPKPTDLDPTFYPVSEKVGEDLLQRLILELLRPLVARWLADSGRQALVGADQFIYWERFNPRKSLAPDLYVIDGVPPETRVTAWKVWETGVVPSFALEIVSSDRLKDYEEAPKRHAELGVEELVLFDPEHASTGSTPRHAFHLYRRSAGELTCVERTNTDRVRSERLGCWLRAVGDGMTLRLRVATGLTGDTIVPTDAERAHHAEAGVARLTAELARPRGPREGG